MQSKATGFIHIGDRIPLFENFCFALVLFRQKLGESVREGKELIDRLLAFQVVDGNFPKYLHEFPKCSDGHMGLKIAPVLFHILQDFSSVLQGEYRQKLRCAFEKMIKPPKSDRFMERYQALLGNRPAPKNCKTATDWYEWICSDQLFEKGASYPIPYNSNLELFTGHHFTQDKGAPERTPIESVLGDGLPGSLISQLHAGLLYPFTSSIEETSSVCWSQDGRLLWRGGHSLVAPNASVEENLLLFNLEGSAIDLFECSIFTNLSKNTTVFVNGERGTVFSLDDRLTIVTPELTLRLTFESDQGVYIGHISRGNRPGQVALEGENLYTAYDWNIALRTIQREGPGKVTCQLRFC